MSADRPPLAAAQWPTSSDPRAMLQVTRRSRPSARKFRLFNAAVCRRFWSYLPAELQGLLVESEQIADGLLPVPADDMELCHRANAVVARFDRQYPGKKFPSREVRIQRDSAAAVCYAVIPDDLFGACSYFLEFDPTEQSPLANLVRDIFPDPFHPVVTLRARLTPNVVALAQSIYTDRAFDRLPHLADVLAEACCNNHELLSHCRTYPAARRWI